MEFEVLAADNDYEIAKKIYPYIIRRRSNKKVIKIGISDDGYNVVHLNTVRIRLHRVIAQQYIPNPDNLPDVDHKNHIKTDNRISNLRWVTSSTNQNNRAGYNGYKANYVDTLSEDAIKVNKYGVHDLDYVYFDDDKFFFYTGLNYRELHYNDEGDGNIFVLTKDTKGKTTKIRLNQYKKIIGLI